MCVHRYKVDGCATAIASHGCRSEFAGGEPLLLRRHMPWRPVLILLSKGMHGMEGAWRANHGYDVTSFPYVRDLQPTHGSTNPVHTYTYIKKDNK